MGTNTTAPANHSRNHPCFEHLQLRYPEPAEAPHPAGTGRGNSNRRE